MNGVVLRPLSFGEILDQSFGLFRQLFVPLVLVQIICSGVPLLLNIYFAASGSTSIGTTFGMYLVAFVAGALATAATAWIISENYLGRSLEAPDALRRSLPRIGAVMLLSISVGFVVMIAALPAGITIGAGSAFAVVAAGEGGGGTVTGGLLVLLGIALLVLPIIVFSGLAIATPALVLEDLGAGRAMSRSWFLTKGFRLRVIGLLFVVIIIIMIPVVAIGALGGIFGAEPSRGANVAFTALTGVVSLIITPIFYCVLTLLYYDLRVRKEAFDLEMLAAELHADSR